ncbi:MAG: HAMP domain-containing sensor histidine kinase [Pseudomonadota bacterium]
MPLEPGMERQSHPDRARGGGTEKSAHQSVSQADLSQNTASVNGASEDDTTSISIAPENAAGASEPHQTSPRAHPGAHSANNGAFAQIAPGQALSAHSPLVSAHHDLRQLSRGVVSLAEIVQSQPQTGAASMRYRQQLADLLLAATTLDRRIASLYQLERVAQSIEPIDCHEVDLVPVADEIFRRFRAVAANRGITLTFDQQCEEFIVHTDITIISRMIENLVGNAIEHGARRSVVLRINELDIGQAKIDVWDDGGRMSRKRVSDFRKAVADGTHDHLERGYGLRTIAALGTILDVDISVLCRPDRLTLFSLRLPKIPQYGCCDERG